MFCLSARKRLGSQFVVGTFFRRAICFAENRQNLTLLQFSSFQVAIVSSLIFRASSRSISSISTLWASPDHIPSSDPMFSLSASSSDSSGGSESVAWVLRFGGLMALCAAALTRYIPLTRTERLRRDEVDAGTDGEDSDGEGEGQDDDDGVAVR